MNLNKYLYSCAYCKTPCCGVSKGEYLFDNDLKFSESFEDLLINELNSRGFNAFKNINLKGPDVTVMKDNKLICYVEVKVQRRAFRKVYEVMPESKLLPSEAVALGYSDLVRYFDLSDKMKVPIFVAWVVSERPCINKSKFCFFYQDINELKRVHDVFLSKRLFRRSSGVGDVVDGEHLGCVLVYHFSLNELKEGVDGLVCDLQSIEGIK